ncbi:hypothetical protein B7P43_G04562 [Cryptotermes secundus]|uniref:Uncharacterized protein n=1 Tax=Cryptotermes secundus TaxID=105785 RepID=A0A2J7QLP7_9NEOP|nr:hypothetical protein B7P43_G04562 [Cryptotermes secundus]
MKIRSRKQKLGTVSCKPSKIYIILRGSWSGIIVMNVHAPTEDKIDDIKDRFYEEVNFATSENLTVKSTKFPRRNIHKFTLRSPDGKTHNQTDHILIDRRRHSMSKQTTHRVHMERFNLKKLNEVEGKVQYRVDVSNGFATFESLDTEVDVSEAWETIRENIKISAQESLGYYEPKKHKPWFDEGRSKLLDQRKQTKLQWLQDPSDIHKGEPLVPDPSPFEVEIDVVNLKRYKLTGSDQIQAELIEAVGEILRSKINRSINFIFNKEELPDQWKESIIVPVHKKVDRTYCSNDQGISLLSTSYKILSIFSQG